MKEPKRPGLDEKIVSRQLARDGQPISYNHAPADDLAPWVSRLFVTIVQMPADYTLHCGLLNDCSFVRIQLAGDWRAETPHGVIETRDEALFFGPQSHRIPISVTGSFISLGCSFRPGTATALKTAPVGDYIDRIVPLDVIGTPSQQMVAMFDPQASPQIWLEVLEQHLRRRITALGAKEPDRLATQFELHALRDPSQTIDAVAAACGTTRRTLERIVSRDFGMSPKQVMRRARALDMASHLRGFADAREAEDIALRYYDDSHRNREFAALFGMTTLQFIKRPQPILGLGLESRQARRLEILGRLDPALPRPWN